MMLPGAKEEEEGSNIKSVHFFKENSRIIMRKSISMNFDLRFRRVVTRHIEQERASSGLKSWLRLGSFKIYFNFHLPCTHAVDDLIYALTFAFTSLGW